MLAQGIAVEGIGPDPGGTRVVVFAREVADKTRIGKIALLGQHIAGTTARIQRRAPGTVDDVRAAGLEQRAQRGCAGVLIARRGWAMIVWLAFHNWIVCMPKARKPTIVPRGDQGGSPASPNLEQYVETIAHLLTKDKVCTVSDIATVAQVTRPAASRAVRELAEKDLVVHKAYSYVDLTTRGRKLAEQLSLRHDKLQRFLQCVLKYDEKAADREACRLEHQIDDELAQRLDTLTTIFADNPDLQKHLDILSPQAKPGEEAC